MKRMVRLLVISFLLFGIVLTVNGTITYAAHILESRKSEHDNLSEQPKEEPYIESVNMECTAYCLQGETATGTQTRPGIAASKREWFGRTIIVYSADKDGKPKDYIGQYVIEDTGSRNIRNGKVLDIWLPTEYECKQFGRRNVVVFFTD